RAIRIYRVASRFVVVKSRSVYRAWARQAIVQDEIHLREVTGAIESGHRHPIRDAESVRSHAFSPDSERVLSVQGCVAALACCCTAVQSGHGRECRGRQKSKLHKCVLWCGAGVTGWKRELIEAQWPAGSSESNPAPASTNSKSNRSSLPIEDRQSGTRRYP